MKQDELKPCCICDQGLMHKGNVTFYRVNIQRLMINTKAVERQHGLEMMTVSHVLARVLGPDEDLAQKFDETSVLICENCGNLEDIRIGYILEKEEERQDD